jgi:pimeloyl-ACP methyl ester carboxylesterase
MKKDTARFPSLVLTDHEFQVPLDHSDPDGEQITVFAREVVAPTMETENLPWLLFLAGGPGFPSPRPQGRSGWLKRALEEYRVLLLDDRGTGRSTPVNHQTLARFPSGQAQAEYLAHFRADAIVQDAELIRRELLGEDKKWSVLGQSYGGFCLAHYLSVAPEGLREGIFTGGLPPIGQSIDDVYRATYGRVLELNHRYYARYPGDRERAREIVEYLGINRVALPGGGTLSPRRFQQLGIKFGGRNGFELVHYLLETGFVQGARGPELSFPFLREVEENGAFETNPIYALLHEPIYCEGAASNWSAQRVRAEFPEFSLAEGQPVFFTGEMIYPWMFDEYVHLRPVKETAEILAGFEDWPALYDRDRLAQNTVPCVATVYYDDMYVERRFAEEAARLIKSTRIWLTNAYDHSGLRMDGEVVLDRLLGMLYGEA